jgi:cytochrome b pre-mRNA-processing protein 3
MALKALSAWFNRSNERETTRALYQAIVAQARQTHWYEEGGVADTIDGRFDMVNVVLALVLIRMEALGESANLPSTLLAETFVEDMDGQMRELGMGDVVVGKNIGKMMAALGGRLGVYRNGFTKGDLREVLVRNVYRGHSPTEVALLHTINSLLTLRDRLFLQSLDDLMAGRLQG